MPFQIIRLDTGAPHLEACGSGLPLLFDDGANAAREAEALTELTGAKHQPRPVREETNAWREREAARFASGEYEQVPWDQQYWWRASDHSKNHFAHVAAGHKAQIAYTQSDDRGSQDRQTRTKPGRYLQQYFGHELTGDNIQWWSAQWAEKFALPELKFATTPDDIEHVYCNGPSSCMSGEPNEYASPCHPTRVYGAGDLAVAYIELDDKISARAVVYPVKKVYARPYGYDELMVSALKAAGYQRSDVSFLGARLLRIPARTGEGIVLPYLDFAGGAKGGSDDKYIFVANRDVEYPGDQTNGVTGNCSEPCGRCGDRFAPDDLSYVQSADEHWCGDCCEHLWTCDRCSSELDDGDEGGSPVEGETWCDECVDAHAGRCEATDELLCAKNLTEDRDGRTVSTYWLDEHPEHAPPDDDDETPAPAGPRDPTDTATKELPL